MINSEAEIMSDRKKLNMSGIFKGIVFSLVITFVFMMLVALACYFCNVSDRLLGFLVLMSAGVSVFLGALLASKISKSAGIWHGAVLGLGYIVLLILSNIILRQSFSLNIGLISMTVCISACGMLGGILGVAKS